MTANHGHTPTTGQVETGFALYLYDRENIVISSGRDRFKAWLAERDARIEAAAEQRGRIAELREVVAEFEHQDPNDLRNNSMRDGQVWTLESCMSAHIASAPILDWLENRADQMEGGE